MRLRLFVLLPVLFTFSRICVSQPSAPTPNWDSWHFLLGEWVGEGTGSPGEGTGGFTFALDLQNRVLVRKNFAEYPAAKDRPAFRHDDIMIVYQEPGTPTRAEYFDNEGHVIHYTVSFSSDSGSIVFVSDVSAPGPRFRLTNTKQGTDRMMITFEIAPPGKPEAFQPYIKASARRKQ